MPLWGNGTSVARNAAEAEAIWAEVKRQERGLNDVQAFISLPAPSTENLRRDWAAAAAALGLLIGLALGARLRPMSAM